MTLVVEIRSALAPTVIHHSELDKNGRSPRVLGKGVIDTSRNVAQTQDCSSK